MSAAYREARNAQFSFEVELGRRGEWETLRAERGLSLVGFLGTVALACAIAGLATGAGVWVAPLPALMALTMWRMRRQQAEPETHLARGSLDAEGLFIEQESGPTARFRWDIVRGAKLTPRAVVILLTCGLEVVARRRSDRDAAAIVAFVEAHAGARSVASRDRTFAALALGYLALTVVVEAGLSGGAPVESEDAMRIVAEALMEGRDPERGAIDAALDAPCGRVQLLTLLNAHDRLDLAPGDPRRARAELQVMREGVFACSIAPVGRVVIEDAELGAVEYLVYEMGSLTEEEGHAIMGPYTETLDAQLPTAHVIAESQRPWTTEDLAREAGALHWRAFGRAGAGQPTFVPDDAPAP